MKKETRNLMVLLVLLVPCALVVCDEWALRLLGAAYAFGYWHNIGRPLYSEYRRLRRPAGKNGCTAV